MRHRPLSALRRLARSRRGMVLMLLLAAAACAQLSVLAMTGQATRLVMHTDDQSEAWVLQADRLVGQGDSEIVEAHGNVVMRHGDDYLKADFARYFRGTNWVFLKGEVQASWNEDKLHADEAEFDLTNQVGWLKNGQLYVARPHLFFKGDYIHKQSGDTYAFKNAKVTACDAAPGESPAWSFTAREGDITLDGYARLWSASFNVKDQTVAASPYLAVPIRTTRSSGLLMPETSYSSRHGVSLNAPVFWAINDTSDMTLYENIMSKRGVMQGVEYRMAPAKGVKGLWRLDWLYDQETAKTEADAESPLDEDGLVRANAQRWWLRGMFNGRLDEWDVKSDVDVVSDQDYLREFSSGLSGYDKSRGALLEEFDRDTNAADQNRTSTFMVSRDFERVGLMAKAEYNQDASLGHGNTDSSTDASVQRLPEVTAYLFKNTVGTSPVELEADMAAAHLWRQYGAKGGRIDVHPRVSLPLRNAYGSVIPTIGWRETVYATDWHPSDDAAGRGSYTARSLPDLDLATYTEAWKVFDVQRQNGPDLNLAMANLGNSAWTKMRHSVQPRLSYHYIPSVDQRDKPYYDHVDRIGAVNELRYSLTNVLGRKRETVAAREEDGKPKPTLQVDYNDFLKLRLEQTYSIREARRMDELGTYPRRPFSDALADVTLAVNRYVDLFSRTWYSPYRARITEHEHGLKALWPGQATASMSIDFRGAIDEYTRQDQDEMHILWLEASTSPLRSWTLGLRYGADIHRGRDLEKQVVLSYLHQCFDLSVIMSKDSFEERFEIVMGLAGINVF
ncbi:MAG: LPS-assembly protein LptD [Desulfovibrionaceae bacterium]